MAIYGCELYEKTVYVVVFDSYSDCDHCRRNVLHIYFNINLDKRSSKNIQDILVMPKERLYIGKSGKIRIISGFLVKKQENQDSLKKSEINQESKHAARRASTIRMLFRSAYCYWMRTKRTE